MAIVVVFAIVVAGLLVFQQFTRALHEATQTRIGFIASQLRDDVEAGMNLGFDLAELRQAQGWLVRERHQQPEIHSILIFDERGIVLFSTNLAEIGETIPTRWRTPDISGGQREWHLEQAGMLVAGAPLSTSFGTKSGGVAVRLPRDVVTRQVERFGLKLAGAGLAIGVVSVILVSLGAGILVRPLSRNLQAMAGALRALVKSDGDARIDGKDDVALATMSFPWYHEFDDALRRVLSRLYRSDAEVDRLDEMA